MGFSYLPNPCFGSDELGLCLGCCEWTWAWREAHRAIGLVDGYLAYLFIPISCPRSPCVWIAWARAVIIFAMVAISTCLLGYGLINLIAVTRGVLMMAFWVLRLFFILSLFPFVSCRPPSFEFLWRFNFPFHLVSLYFVFSWIFICPFSVGSFSGVFLIFLDLYSLN